ncbi:zinc finger protein 479-like isoform X2 [Patiria miniata]|nr:zinc finger protein 479-like isoform X2 [Patiria miniata]
MEDSDDLHVCLKCHDQIVGLDNYIEHRRSSCLGRPKEVESPDDAAGGSNQTVSQTSSGISKTSDTNSKNGSLEDTAVNLEVEGSDEQSTVAQNNGEIRQQKRKIKRPQRIPQSAVKEKSFTTLERPSRPQRVKRSPLASKLYVVDLPKDTHEKKKAKSQPPATGKQLHGQKDSDKDESELGTDAESEEEEQEQPLRSKKSKRGRKPKVLLTEEEETLLAGCKVKKDYQCKLCSFVTPNKYSMVKHFRTIKHLEHIGSSNPDSVFACDACPMKFFSEKGLERHKVRHEQQGRCMKCDIEFETRKELQDHNKVEHAKSRQKVYKGTVEPCKECGKKLAKGYMKIHMRIHTGERPFACELCPQRFNQHGDLKMHTKRHYGIKDHKCSLCNFITVKASILKNHMKLHTKRERTEACHLCPQKFYNQALLKSHVRLKHHPCRVFLCTVPECTYKFKFRTELVIHMRRHTNEKPYLCTVCGYTGSTKQALSRHSRKHTGAKPFKCDHPGCNYMGRVSTHLTRHKRLHTGEKPYKCPYCSYRANTHENVRKHIRSTKKHAGFAVYMCKFCSEMKTDLYQELVDHMRKMHYDDYVTFDQISHHSGLLADKETPLEVTMDQPDTMEETEDQPDTNKIKNVIEIHVDGSTADTNLGQDLQLAADADQSTQVNVTAEENRQDLEMMVRDADVGETQPNLCKEYILCQVIQDGSQPQHQGQGDGTEAVEGSEGSAAGDSGEMQEIQMVSVEEGQATEALEMILRQAVSDGSTGSQEYIIL